MKRSEGIPTTPEEKPQAPMRTHFFGILALAVLLAGGSQLLKAPSVERFKRPMYEVVHGQDRRVKSYGQLTYYAPHSVSLPDSFNVDVAIERSATASAPSAPLTAREREDLGLPVSGDIQSQPVEIGDQMVMTLTPADPETFTVVATDNQPKSLVAKGHAEWHWTVTPLKQGNYNLNLHWQVLHTLPNGALSPPQDLGHANATITVTVKPWAQRVLSASDQVIRDNWKAILSYFLPASGLTLIGLFWKKNRDKKSDEKEPDGDDEV